MLDGHESEQDLLFKVSEAYYLEGATQAEVGRRFGLSRVKVSRLLKRARDEQMVQISVTPPTGSLAGIEQQLANHLGLDELIIADLDAVDGAAVLAAIAAAATPVLLRHLCEGTTLAVSWGATLAALVAALPRRPVPRATVVQMLGGLGRVEHEAQGADIARRLAMSLEADCRLLASPGIVASKEVRDALISDPQIYDTLALAASAQVALVGIGTPSRGAPALRDAATLSVVETEELASRGAVGDISLRHYDANGQLVATGLSWRIIGLELAQICQIPCVIAVAGGMAKFTAIRGALTGHLINVLVTDVYVARRILEEVERGQL